jgi:hypothetical protein
MKCTAKMRLFVNKIGDICVKKNRSCHSCKFESRYDQGYVAVDGYRGGRSFCKLNYLRGWEGYPKKAVPVAIFQYRLMNAVKIAEELLKKEKEK